MTKDKITNIINTNTMGKKTYRALDIKTRKDINTIALIDDVVFTTRFTIIESLNNFLNSIECS